MKRVLITIFAAFITLAAAAQSPIVQARLEPSHGILVGQPIRMVVTVYVPNYFTGSPDFPEFEIENAIVVCLRTVLKTLINRSAQSGPRVSPRPTSSIRNRLAIFMCRMQMI